MRAPGSLVSFPAGLDPGGDRGARPAHLADGHHAPQMAALPRARAAGRGAVRSPARGARRRRGDRDRSAAVLELTYAEYLAREAASKIRHEFFEGEIYAMAGGSLAHAALSANVGAALLAAVRDRP